MTTYSKVRFSYPNDHYVEATIIFDGDEFEEAVGKLNAFVYGVNVIGEVRATIMEITRYPNRTLNIFSYRAVNELGAFISKYGATS